PSPEWSNTQTELRKQLITVNHNLSFNPETFEGLNFIADEANLSDANVSTSETAIVCLAVLAFPSLQLVHSIVKSVELPLPYIPGFLAMREFLFIDGNGVFHPRQFGVACQVGVLADIPTIGIAKTCSKYARWSADGRCKEVVR
ncbi:hypothetical protein BCR33DRAFT_712547, partial [Rhizoclosmatium globosum]